MSSNLTSLTHGSGQHDPGQQLRAYCRPQGLAEKLAARAGIVAHGLFLNLTRDVIVTGSEGVRHLTCEQEP